MYDCGNSIAKVLELPQSCAKPSIFATSMETKEVGVSFTLLF